jgi:Icc-related predicted phosphoesterase
MCSRQTPFYQRFGALFIFSERGTFEIQVYFIRGNHEDFNWLDSMCTDSKDSIVNVDPFGIFHYVIDGTVLSQKSINIAFLGGIETEKCERKSINASAYEKLMQLDPGAIDILITHDAPYGVASSYTGITQGSQLITELINKIQPRYLIAGHYHHLNGPTNFGNTIYLGLNILVPPIRRDPSRKVQPGSIAVLDTDKDTLNIVTDEWLSTFANGLDYNLFISQVKKMTDVH